MRTRHAQYSLPAFPVYSAAFVSDNLLVLGGGGGSSRSGIKNKLRLYKISDVDKLDLVSQLELDNGEDAPMSVAADTDDLQIICGINSPADKCDSDENQNCRIYSLTDNAFKLSRTASTLRITSDNPEDYQKVTALSPGRIVVAAAGNRDFALLSYPNLTPVINTLRLAADIQDVAFTSTTIVIATADKILAYELPLGVSEINDKVNCDKGVLETVDMKLSKTIKLPKLPILTYTKCLYRAVRFHPTMKNVCFTVVNCTLSGTRSKVAKSSPKQGYVSRWNSDTWEVERSRKVGEKGITCFDVSANGRFLAYGSADYTIGILDSNTLAPLLSVLNAHDFPPTVLRFSPSSSLLVSGSADNTVRMIAVPEKLSGTTWTLGSVFLLGLLILLISIMLPYLYAYS